MTRFRFLPHTTDAFVEAYGLTLEEAFENAALAMFEVMTDTSKVKPLIEETVKAEGFDEQALLYDWLERLLIMFEVNMRLYSKFKVEEIASINGGFRLRAKVWGEDFNPSRHEQKVGVKAVTYHMMEIRRRRDRWVLRFLLDI